jgi:hypothetical protein
LPFLRDIPVDRRVGDYAHCIARVLHILFKRTMACLPPRGRTDLQLVLQEIKEAADVGGTRPSINAAIDIGGARAFLTSADLMGRTIDVVRKHIGHVQVQWPGGQLESSHGILLKMIGSLRAIHSHWRQAALLTQAEIAAYMAHVALFRQCWQVLDWKVSIWVHWLCAHSGYFMGLYRHLYGFSSLPTERRHQHFKMDLRHAFHGWKLTNPLIGCKYLQHLVELDAMDLGLLMCQLQWTGKRRRLQ